MKQSLTKTNYLAEYLRKNKNEKIFYNLNTLSPKKAIYFITEILDSKDGSLFSSFDILKNSFHSLQNEKSANELLEKFEYLSFEFRLEVGKALCSTEKYQDVRIIKALDSETRQHEKYETVGSYYKKNLSHKEN